MDEGIKRLLTRTRQRHSAVKVVITADFFIREKRDYKARKIHLKR